MTRQQKAKLEERAKELLADNGIDSIPVPVDRIARELGAEVKFQMLDEELSGLICIKDGVPIIGINALHHPNRQRFTLAHEIAHLQLHKEHITNSVHVDKRFNEPVLKRDATSTEGTDQLEIEANQFAAALLIPRAILEDLLESSPLDIDDDGPLEELSKKFQVSKATLQYRIRNMMGESGSKRR
jgi:Zn-dependent peptidase ImmA (M78 family)